MDGHVSSEGEQGKAVRALLKKLRHIEGLQERRARGDALDAQQLATVARAGAVAAELASLEGGGGAGAAGAPLSRPAPPPSGEGNSAPSKRDRDRPHASASKRARAEPAAPAPRAPPTPAAAPDGVETCGFCRKAGHRASHCTFGRLPSERLMLCPSTTPCAACAPRLFVLPMRRCATDFDPQTPRAGRVDVGLRCASAALFRSQGLRRNTQVALCFEGEPAAESAPAGPRAGAPGAPDAAGVVAPPPAAGSKARTVTVSGGLVRDLRPDELSLAQRLRAALDDEHGGHAGACALDDSAYSASALRGIECSVGGALETLVAALRAYAPRHGAEGAANPPVVLVLDDAGEPVEAVCALLGGAGGVRPAGGVVVVVGDDRGLTADEQAAVAAAAREVGAPILRVSLGCEVLFASHCIVLLHHYLDKLWHGCAHAPGRTYSTSTRKTAARPRHRPE